MYLSYIESKKISLDFSSIQEFISECKVYYSPSTLKVIKSGVKGYLEQIAPLDDRYFALIAKIEMFLELFKDINFDDGETLSLEFRNNYFAIKLDDINDILEYEYDDEPITIEEIN